MIHPISEFGTYFAHNPRVKLYLISQRRQRVDISNGRGKTKKEVAKMVLSELIRRRKARRLIEL